VGSDQADKKARIPCLVFRFQIYTVIANNAYIYFLRELLLCLAERGIHHLVTVQVLKNAVGVCLT